MGEVKKERDAGVVCGMGGVALVIVCVCVCVSVCVCVFVWVGGWMCV